MSPQHAAPEMARSLRQLVDNYLEESQFESGIAILDQMRSPEHKPSTIHVLHLIFIALHSAAHDTRLDESGAEPTYDPTALLLQSPRKIVKQTKSGLVISPDTVVAAQHLLCAFINTNIPSDIDEALPHYPDNEARRQLRTEDENRVAHVDVLDSPIYNKCIAMKGSRSIWEILKEGYTSRARESFGTTPGKGKQKSRTLGRDVSFSSNTGVDEIDVVGEDSWFLLEWFVSLLEKDSEITEAAGQGKYSPLLLRQLPPPPLNTSVRWDTSEPLKVIAFSLTQPDKRRQHIGLRLLNLLIDLSQTPYLSLPSLTSSTLAQIASVSQSSSNRPSHTHSPASSSRSSTTPPPLSAAPIEPHNPLLTLLDQLSSATPCLAFKISLCQKILQDNGDGEPAAPAPRPAPKPRATARSRKINDPEPPPAEPAPTEQPSVPAQKRPVPRPRPVMRTIPHPTEPENTAPTAPATPPPVKAAPARAATQDTPKPAAPSLPAAAAAAAAPAPAPPVRPPLPAFDNVALVLKMDATPQPVAPPSRKRRRGADPPAAPAPAQTPWAAPRVVLRVKFELLLACVTLAKRTHADLAARAGELEAREDVQDWSRAVADGRMRELLRGAFGPQPAAASAEEAEDREFYADVIKAIVGYE